MAVSIDTVYQRVLVLANKEQRGYITPQEFNLLANQSQMEIFEQYFYDIKQYDRAPGNMQEYSDPLSVLYEKIGLFEVDQDEVWMITNMPSANNIMEIPHQEIYKIGTISIGKNQVEMLNSKDFDAARCSPLTAPTLGRPIGFTGSLGLKVAIAEDTYATPSNNLDMSINYIMRPPTVQWAYVVVNDKPLYNDNIAVNFSLHASEETELVYKILKLAGINLKAQEVVQVGQTLEQTQIQQEKQ
tara:strand:- start:9583 stop:10311 length:729 start_codon:yes stop_codon:yes gene_type:complete